MDKIKNQLAGVAALLGVIAAIGGGFVKYGEIVTKLDALEGASCGVDFSPKRSFLSLVLFPSSNSLPSITYAVAGPPSLYHLAGDGDTFAVQKITVRIHHNPFSDNSRKTFLAEVPTIEQEVSKPLKENAHHGNRSCDRMDETLTG